MYKNLSPKTLPPHPVHLRLLLRSLPRLPPLSLKLLLGSLPHLLHNAAPSPPAASHGASQLSPSRPPPPTSARRSRRPPLFAPVAKSPLLRNHHHLGTSSTSFPFRQPQLAAAHPSKGDQSQSAKPWRRRSIGSGSSSPSSSQLAVSSSLSSSPLPRFVYLSCVCVWAAG
jgi:hypothetical protein